MVLKGMVDQLIETGTHCGMETNVERTKVMKISRQPPQIGTRIDKKQSENVEYFNFLGSMITSDARCTREIKSSIAMTKAAFNKKKTFHQQIGLKFKEKTIKVLHLEHSFVWS
jgi:hypothetical protein